MLLFRYVCIAGPARRTTQFFLAGPPSAQLHFALQNARKWRPVYDDFNYEEFYNFIVDYFEADPSPEGRKAARELLDWWNQ